LSRRAKILIGVLGALAAAVAALVVLFDWNWLKPYAEARASAQLGRPVSIGHLDVDLGRETLVMVDRFTIGNPSGFPENTNLAEFERMTFTVDLIRYWTTGELFVPALTVDKPVVKAETNAAGEPNWILEQFKPSASDEERRGAPEIGRLTVNDGHVSLIDPKTKTNVQMAVHTEPDPQGGDSQIVFRGEGQYAETHTKFQARAGSLSNFRDADTRYPIDLTWEVGSTRAKITGTVRNRTNLAGMDGQLEVSGPDMSLLYPITGIPFPPTPPYKLKGHLWHAGTVIHFDEFDGKFGSSDLSGSLAVDTGGPRRVVTADLNSTKTVLADLGGFIGMAPGKADAANATRRQRAATRADSAKDKAVPEKRLNMAKAGEVDAHVVYRAKRLESDYLPVDDLHARLDLENGQLRLKPLNFGIGKGRIAMAVDIDTRPKVPKWDIDADFRNVDLRRILQKVDALEGAGLVGGRAQIAGSGHSVSEVLGRGDGHLVLAMTSGQISALLTELAGLDLLEALGFALSGKDKTFRIRCMVTDAKLDDGVLRTNSFVMDTTDTNIGGAGWVNFRDETIGFRLEAHPKDVSLLSFRAPVHVSGTLKKPKVSIDAAATGARVGAMAVLGALLTPLAALIPTIELGLGKDSDCAGLIDSAARSAQQADQPTKKATDPQRNQKARR